MTCSCSASPVWYVRERFLHVMVHPAVTEAKHKAAVLE
jgi:hypothetical protein